MGSVGKTFYLIDTFAGVDEEMILASPHSEAEIQRNRQNIKTGFYVQGLEEVVPNFSQWRNVRIIQGRVPDTLSMVETAHVSYLLNAKRRPTKYNPLEVLRL
jgi:hypothetical protein